MDIKELQNLTDKLGTVAVVEQGEPRFLVIRFDKFQELINGHLLGEQASLPLAANRNYSGLDTGDNLSPKQESGLIPLKEIIVSPPRSAVETEEKSRSAISDNQASGDESQLIESLNKEITALKEEIEAREHELGL